MSELMNASLLALLRRVREKMGSPGACYDVGGVCYCLANFDLSDGEYELVEPSLPWFSAAPGRSHAEVLALLDGAIAAEEAGR